MNKQEKIIAILLGCCLAGWMWYSVSQAKKAATYQAQQAAAQKTAAPAPVPAAPQPAPAVAPKPETVAAKPAEKRAPEQVVALTNDQVIVRFTTHGGAVKGITLRDYAERAGAISETNPALSFDFAAAPALALEGVAGAGLAADYAVTERGPDYVLFAHATGTRRITLKPDYQLELKETFTQPDTSCENRLGLGVFALGASQNDLLSVDSLKEGPKPVVVHHGDEDPDSPLKAYLVAGGAGGCSGSKAAVGMEPEKDVDVPGTRGWIAMKNRFFVSALARSSVANHGFRAHVTRNLDKAEYAPRTLATAAAFTGLPAERTSVFFIGPKRQALLWDLDMRDVMEFGMWRWICYPTVWLLNFFNNIIPNYGIAIILLTIFVRLVFWPLTHKSTLGMRRMQEIQPKVKAIQAQFKDNPQRLQQEMMQLYRTEKVNPMSSCLPMIVQIPVFIALFTVLRAAVELRYAPFLWIADLSEPESLFRSWFPIGGGLNILPIVMAGLTMLQSAFTPSTGDNKQQRMMMYMMPLIMLFMFYNFASALSLYWALSTAIGVAQSWWIRRKYGTPATPQGGAVSPDSVEMPQTRQMRRHS